VPADWVEGATKPIGPAADGPTVTRPDGRIVPVRRAKLSDVCLGMFAVDDVPCLVLPDGEADAAVLGRAVLDRLFAWVDLMSDRLTLARPADAPADDGVRVVPAPEQKCVRKASPACGPRP
jgi:hypothetical protein